MLFSKLKYCYFTADDTTAATLSWLLDVLSEQPQWQNKLREAVDEFLEENPDPTMEDYEGFALLNAIIKVSPARLIHDCVLDTRLD